MRVLLGFFPQKQTGGKYNSEEVWTVLLRERKSILSIAKEGESLPIRNEGKS